jgi:hypothetical protein
MCLWLTYRNGFYLRYSVSLKSNHPEQTYFTWRQACHNTFFTCLQKESILTLTAQQGRNINFVLPGNCCGLSGCLPSSWTESHSLGNTQDTRSPHHGHGLPQQLCRNVHPWSAPSTISWTVNYINRHTGYLKHYHSYSDKVWPHAKAGQFGPKL